MQMEILLILKLELTKENLRILIRFLLLEITKPMTMLSTEKLELDLVNYTVKQMSLDLFVN